MLVTKNIIDNYQASVSHIRWLYIGKSENIFFQWPHLWLLSFAAMTPEFLVTRSVNTRNADLFILAEMISQRWTSILKGRFGLLPAPQKTGTMNMPTVYLNKGVHSLQIIQSILAVRLVHFGAIFLNELHVTCTTENCKTVTIWKQLNDMKWIIYSTCV